MPGLPAPAVPDVAVRPAAPQASPRAAAPPQPTGPTFSVQVGAFNERAQADAAASRLRARGTDARVEGQGPRGDAPPFRVRVGRFPTRAAADAERHTLAARGTQGFVAENPRTIARDTAVVASAPPRDASPPATPSVVAASPLDETPDDSSAAAPRAARRARTAENPSARCRIVNLNDSPATARLNSLSDGQGRYISYIGGGAVARCEGVNNVLRADSAEYYQAAGLLVLVNNVSYDEPQRARLSADRLTYYTADERLVAEGNVVVTLPTGTTMTGPNAEYLRAAPPLRAASRLTAPGRPTVRVVGGATPPTGAARTAARRDTSVTTIVANTVIDDADSVVYASGQVEITRTDVVANSDSAVFEQDTERARLIRDARIRGTGERAFTLTGAQVDLYTRDRQLARVLARRDARVVSDSLTLTSDTVDLRLGAGVSAGLLERAYAWGPSRAKAVSPGRDVVADSIAAYLPRQRVREIRALRQAVARTEPDTTKLRSTERDVFRGDTVVARFDSAAAERDTTRNPPVRQLVAAGDASSLFQVASRQGKEGRPAINYVRGTTITVDFDSGQVREVRVFGQSDGVYLEPNDSTAGDSTAADSGRRATPRAPSRPAPRTPNSGPPRTPLRRPGGTDEGSR